MTTPTTVRQSPSQSAPVPNKDKDKKKKKKNYPPSHPFNTKTGDYGSDKPQTADEKRFNQLKGEALAEAMANNSLFPR